MSWLTDPESTWLTQVQDHAQRDKDTAIQDLTNVKNLQTAERGTIHEKFSKLLHRITDAEGAKDAVSKTESIPTSQTYYLSGCGGRNPRI